MAVNADPSFLITDDQVKAVTIWSLGKSLQTCDRVLNYVRARAGELEEHSETCAALGVLEGLLAESIRELTECRKLFDGALNQLQIVSAASKATAYCEVAGRIRFFNFVAETILRDGAESCRAAVAEKSPRLLRRFDLLARCIREGMAAGEYAETESPREWLRALRKGRQSWE